MVLHACIWGFFFQRKPCISTDDISLKYSDHIFVHVAYGTPYSYSNTLFVTIYSNKCIMKVVSVAK